MLDLLDGVAERAARALLGLPLLAVEEADEEDARGAGPAQVSVDQLCGERGGQASVPAAFGFDDHGERVGFPGKGGRLDVDVGATSPGAGAVDLDLTVEDDAPPAEVDLEQAPRSLKSSSHVGHMAS
ncbi:hypothetical protein [Streptomyces sp. NPDC056938]|uniref:hypothetical protein n=1 Tax=unclassified Streptomyces TaxID=2593676 RepID=UPI0036299A02